MVTDKEIQEILDCAEPGVGELVDQYDGAARYYIGTAVGPSIHVFASTGTAVS